MALIDSYGYATSLQFGQRVLVAMCQAAVNIQSEVPFTLLSADVAAAATSITPVATTGFATNDLVAIDYGGALPDTRKITVSGSSFTVTALTNAHKAGATIQKVLWNSINRRNYAKLILNSPATYAPLFAEAICANDPTLVNDTAATDSAINTGIASVFNALCGTV